MIDFIKGKAEEIGNGFIVVETGGLGYFVNTPVSEKYAEIVPNSEIKLHTILQISENSADIYGFLSKDEKELFTIIRSISSFGPKLALALISSITIKDLIKAILNEDKKALKKIPGLGEKKIDRMIIELKQKEKFKQFIKTHYEEEPEEEIPQNNNPVKNMSAEEKIKDIELVLQEFGCTPKEAKEIAKQKFEEYKDLELNEAISKVLEGMK
jgi:Holliday junction DNA helicase RuvA